MVQVRGLHHWESTTERSRCIFLVAQPVRLHQRTHAARARTVSFHNFKSQNFKLSVSNPKNKYVAYLSVLSRISNCQGLGRKNKHEILKTDRSSNNSYSISSNDSYSISSNNSYSISSNNSYSTPVRVGLPAWLLPTWLPCSGKGFFIIPLSKDFFTTPVRQGILYYSSLKGLLYYSSPTRDSLLFLSRRTSLLLQSDKGFFTIPLPKDFFIQAQGRSRRPEDGS